MVGHIGDLDKYSPSSDDVGSTPERSRTVGFSSKAPKSYKVSPVGVFYVR